MTKNKDIKINYTKSPIFLAILEIRFNDDKLIDIEKFSKFKSEVIKIFPNSQKQVVSQLKIDNFLEGQTKISLHNQRVNCHSYTSKDKLSEFTISLNRFNYKQTGDYTNFDDFTKDAKKAWEIHYPLLKEVDISGISIRCFNRIEINEFVNNPTEYFNVSIQAEKNAIKDTVTNYSLRYISKNQNNKNHSIISLSLEDSSVDFFPFVLDIDVHDENPIKNDLELLWNKFELLRIEKDNLFNSLITDKTKKIFL